MSQSYYDLLGVPAAAPVDEIKRAFRREIAKYHPDKVQHLGTEFQEIAAIKAADLTQAYKTLCDEGLRAEYDAGLAGGPGSGIRDPGSGGRAPGSGVRAPGSGRWDPPAPPPPPAPQSTRETPRPAPAEERSASGTTFATDRAGASDLVRRAAVARFRQALDAEFGHCDATTVQGFDIACAPQKGRFWSKLPPRILARVVGHVDAAAVSDSWATAVRAKRDDQREVCLFLMGPTVAPPGELARAIADERRRPTPAGPKLILVPVNTRSWAAHIPNDAPPVVKALVGRLKSL